MKNTDQCALRRRLTEHSQRWIETGLPSRQRLITIADELKALKAELRVDGVWSFAPRLLTATIDDGMGHGLTLIEDYAAIAGMVVNRLGLLQSAPAIVSACNETAPHFLGLTVLHGDSEDALCAIGRARPQHTTLVAGGPAFACDKEMASRCHVDFVAVHLGYFIEFILNWTPPDAC